MIKANIVGLYIFNYCERSDAMKRKTIEVSTKVEPGNIFIMPDVRPTDSKGNTSPFMLLTLRQYGQYKK